MLRKSFQRKRSWLGDLSGRSGQELGASSSVFVVTQKEHCGFTNSKQQQEEAGLGGTRGHSGFARVITL